MALGPGRDGDRDRHVATPCEVTADDRTARHDGRVSHTAVQLFEVRARRRRHRDDGAARARAHGGQIRDRGGDGLEAEVL